LARNSRETTRAYRHQAENPAPNALKRLGGFASGFSLRREGPPDPTTCVRQASPCTLTFVQENRFTASKYRHGLE